MASSTNATPENIKANDAPQIAVAEKTSDVIQTTSKKRRKDKLQPIATPDIQFETITLGDDIDSSSSKKKRKKAKKNINDDKKAKSEIINPMQFVNHDCDTFIEDPETEKMLRDIAEERVRINYLLASFGMSDINFVLGETVNSLDNQLSERLRQRNRRRGTMN